MLPSWKVAAEDQVDLLDLAREIAVLRELVVGERDDHVRALRLQPPDRRRRGLDQRCEGDVGPGRGQHVGLGREQPEEADLIAADLHHVQIDRAERRLAVRAEHIGAEPGELGFPDPLCGDLGAEVELVIAQHGDIGAEPIVEIDHLRALGHAGQHRGRDQVAAEGGDAVLGIGALRLQQGRELGEAAAALPRRDLVDVVGMQERDRHRLGDRRAAEYQQRARRGGSRSASL